MVVSVTLTQELCVMDLCHSDKTNHWLWVAEKFSQTGAGAAGEHQQRQLLAFLGFTGHMLVLWAPIKLSQGNPTQWR